MFIVRVQLPVFEPTLQQYTPSCGNFAQKGPQLKELVEAMARFEGVPGDDEAVEIQLAWRHVVHSSRTAVLCPSMDEPYDLWESDLRMMGSSVARDSRSGGQ